MTDHDPETFAYRCVCGQGMHVATLYMGRLVCCPQCSRPAIAPVREGADATELTVDFKSERLHIVPASPRDWKSILTFNGDPVNFRFEVSEPDTPRSLKRMLRKHRFPQGFNRTKRLNLLLRPLDGGDPIGMITLQLDPTHLTAALGILLHHPSHNQGFGTEALRAVLQFAFQTLGVHRLSAMCDAENHACAGMLKKAGFTQEGFLKDWLCHHERGWIDAPMFVCFNPDRPRPE